MLAEYLPRKHPESAFLLQTRTRAAGQLEGLIKALFLFPQHVSRYIDSFAMTRICCEHTALSKRFSKEEEQVRYRNQEQCKKGEHTRGPWDAEMVIHGVDE